MSTRANIIVKDAWNELIFYRHSDGYPETCGKVLRLFLSWVESGKIRDNVGQASGWLILLGAMEYKTVASEAFEANPAGPSQGDYEIKGEPKDWQVGAFEPTTGINGDIEYLYVVDLEKRTLHIDGQDQYRYRGKYSRFGIRPN